MYIQDYDRVYYIVMEKVVNDELTMYSLYIYVYKCICKYCKYIVNKYLDCDFMFVYFCVNISIYLVFVIRVY